MGRRVGGKGKGSQMKTFDVVIAGGGVIGTAIAYFLTRSTDLSVAVIDSKKPGNASRASAGGLWPIGESVGLGCGVIFFKTQSKNVVESADVPPPRPHLLPKFFFDFSLKSNEMFPDLWSELRENHGLDFKLEKTGLKYIIYDEYDWDYARQIADSIPHLSDQLRWYDQQQLHEDEPFVSEEAISALEFTRDDQVNPYLLVEAYREGARREGAVLFLNTEITGVNMSGSKVISVETTEGPIGCGLLINAAGAWASDINKMVTGYDIPVVPIKGQVVLSEKMPKILRSCLSTNDCYIAQKDNGEIYIGSTTEDLGYDTSCSCEELQDLSEGGIRCLPSLRQTSIKRTWAGLRPGTPDEIPILGPINGIDAYLNACGHFRTGILTSPLTAEIIYSLVIGKEPPVDLTPFLLSRFDKSSHKFFQ